MGIFSYTPQKPGRGVRKDGPKLKRPFLFITLFFENFWNFLKINFLFLISCIPVFTIGPSICALTYYSKCVTEDKHMFLLSDYTEYFKKNFFKGFLASVINAVPLFSLYVTYINMSVVPHFANLLFPFVLINIIVIIMSFYVYPMIITYNLPLWAIYKNAFIFTMIKLPFNILVLFLFLLTIVIILCFYYFVGGLLISLLGYGISLVICLVICLLALMSYLNFLTTFSVLPTIKKYMEE